MNFLVPAALAVGLLIGLPILAHLIRRGRVPTREFPPARWVEPTAAKVKRRKRRLQDRPLLWVRCSALLALAALGAAPFVQCSGVALDRAPGEALALAIVIDNSHSMLAEVDGASRWERAKTAASQVLSGAESGDTVTVITAGSPAAVRLPATTDLSAAADALDALSPTSRSTDIADALTLARAIVSAQPQADKRIVILSDFAMPEEDARTLEGPDIAWATPLDVLRKPVPNCAVIHARQKGSEVVATLACNTREAAENRHVLLKHGGETTQIGTLSLAQGTQTVSGPIPPSLANESGPVSLELELSGRDGIQSDNTAPVAGPLLRGTLGVVSTTTPPTGGATLLEQGITALSAESHELRALASPPETQSDLQGFELLVLDDVPGLTPEATEALSEWVRLGGVAVALLGPASARAPLGSSMKPFADGPVRFEPLDANAADSRLHKDLTWRGLQPSSLRALSPKGRARFAATEEHVRGTWDDGTPFLAVRPLGRGLLVTVGLPTDPEQSDFALRPGYLGLLRNALDEARLRRGERETQVGREWRIVSANQPTVTGPAGSEEASAERAPERCTGDCTNVNVWKVTPSQSGRYEITTDEGRHTRIARLVEVEVLQMPGEVPGWTVGDAKRALSQGRSVDLSRWLAFIILGLLSLEIVLRIFSLLSRRGEARAEEAHS